MVVAVTGASGFLGSHVAATLAARGVGVRAVVRDASKSSFLGRLGVSFARGDLADRQSLAAAFAGADAVIANAALAIRHDRPYAEFVAANVTGVENTLEAAADAGVRRVVYVSTVAVHRMLRVYATYGLDTPFLADASIPLSLNFLTTAWKYSLSKSTGEKRAWAIASARDLQLTVVRPGPIYGPRDHKLTARYRALMQQRLVVAPTVRASHVHAGDVALAIAGALDNRASIGRPYLLGGHAVSPFELLGTWKRLAGRGPTLVPLPLPGYVAFDDAPAIRDLGFAPRAIEDGLRDVLAEG